MATAFDAATDGGNNGGTTNSRTFAHTCTGSNRILYITIAGDVYNGNDDIISVTYAAVAATLISKTVKQGAFNRWYYTYRLVAPANGANNVIITAGSVHYILAGAVSYTGADQTNQAFAACSTVLNALTGTLYNLQNNSWIVLFNHSSSGGGQPPVAVSGCTRRTFEASAGIWGILDSNALVTPVQTNTSMTISGPAAGVCDMTMVEIIADGNYVALPTLVQPLYGQDDPGVAFRSPILAGQDVTNTEAASEIVIPSPGYFNNLQGLLTAAPGGTAVRDFYVRVNGIDRTPVVHFNPAQTSVSELLSNIPVVAGDRVSLHAVGTGAPTAANCSWSIEFHSVNPGDTIYGLNSGTFGKLNAANPNQAVLTSGFWRGTSDHFNVLPTAGAITSRRFLVDVAPGAGNAWIFDIYKNGVKQDGTGGSTNCTVTLGGAGVLTASWTGSLPLVAGDTLKTVVTKTGTPADVYCTIGTNFVATKTNEALLLGSERTNISAAATNYTRVSEGGFTWNATEATALLQLRAGITAAYLSKLYVSVTTAPGGGKSVTYSLRVNNASPANSCSALVNNASTTGQDSTNYNALVSGDIIDLRSVPSGTPTLPGNMAWGFVISNSVPTTSHGAKGNKGGHGKGGTSGLTTIGPTLWTPFSDITTWGG